MGTVPTAMIGIWHFKEPATAMEMVSIGLIVIAVMGLHSASRLQISQEPRSRCDNHGHEPQPVVD